MTWTGWRIALCCFSLILTLVIGGEFIAAAQFSPPYDWVHNTIGALGATTCTSLVYPVGIFDVCSPAHVWVNTALVLAGLAMLGISVAGRRIAGFTGWAGLMWVITGVSTTLSGLIPIDVSREWHSFVTLPLFITWPVAVLVGSGQLRGWVARLGFVIGAVGLTAGVWFTMSLGAREFGGLLERLVIWPSMLWVILAAFFGVARIRTCLNNLYNPYVRESAEERPQPSGA